jgi:Zn-dependent protease/predicted transcriptional regulator
MFGKQYKLFKLFGFEVKVDASWIVIAVLITWSLAEGYFPYSVKGMQKQTYWLMGVTGALGLFGSVIFHELWHSLVAKRFGLPMKGITLFIFGGVAEMSDEPPSAKAEFFMALAGPLSSVVISFVFMGLMLLGRRSGWPAAFTGVLDYLRWINLILAAFNLLPAFPLDGGRVLRSIIWASSKNMQKATKISSQIGGFFGLAFIFLGIYRWISTGSLIGGLWWVLIGMFLRNAAQSSYQRIIIKKVLEGVPISKFMKKEVVTVPSYISVAELVTDFIYKYHFQVFPVVDNDVLKGCVNIGQVRTIERDEWERHAVKELMNECSLENAVSPETDASVALSVMSRTGNTRLMVVEDKKLVGIITLKDLLKYLSIKVDFEGGDEKK